jgi:hypothetical protein
VSKKKKARRRMMGATCGGVIIAAVVSGCSSNNNGPDNAQYARVCADQRPGPTNGQRVDDSICDRHTPGFANVDLGVPDSPHETEWLWTDHRHWYAPWSHYSTLDPVDFDDYNYGGTYIPPYGQVINRRSIVVVPAGTNPNLIARGFAAGGGTFTRGGGGLASWAPGARVSTVAGRAFTASPGIGVSGVGNSVSGGSSGRAAAGSVGGYAGSGTVARGGLGVTDSGGAGSKGGTGGGAKGGSSAGS